MQVGRAHCVASRCVPEGSAWTLHMHCFRMRLMDDINCCEIFGCFWTTHCSQLKQEAVKVICVIGCSNRSDNMRSHALPRAEKRSRFWSASRISTYACQMRLVPHSTAQTRVDRKSTRLNSSHIPL